MVCFIIESSKSLQMLKRPEWFGLCSWRGHTWYQMKVSLQVAWIARQPWWHVCWVVLSSRVLIVDFAPQISKHSKSIVELQEALSQMVQISDRKTQSHIQQDGWLAVPKQTFHRDTVNRCLLAFKTSISLHPLNGEHQLHWPVLMVSFQRSWHQTERVNSLGNLVIFPEDLGQREGLSATLAGLYDDRFALDDRATFVDLARGAPRAAPSFCCRKMGKSGKVKECNMSHDDWWLDFWVWIELLSWNSWNVWQFIVVPWSNATRFVEKNSIRLKKIYLNIPDHVHVVECSSFEWWQSLLWNCGPRALSNCYEDRIKDALGQNYAAHFSKTPFALKGGLPGTTARLTAWWLDRNHDMCTASQPEGSVAVNLRFGALAKVVNKGEAPPSLVALLLQFLEAPEPPDPEPEEEAEVATIYMEVPAGQWLKVVGFSFGFMGVADLWVWNSQEICWNLLKSAYIMLNLAGSPAKLAYV